jgi:hypothetical protein
MSGARWLLAMCWLAASPGRANDDAVVAPRSDRRDERVVVIADDSERASRIEASLRARGLVPLGPAEREGLDTAPRRRLGDRERVRTLLLSARGAWRRLELDTAAALVDDALDEALALDRPEDQLALIVDALLFRATLHTRRETPDEGRADLILASRLEPNREALDPALHPPSLLQAWTSARVAARGADLHAVVVRPRVVSDGSVDAELLVDGQPVVAPDGVLDLQAGPHLLTVRAPGCRSVSRVVDVEGTGLAFEDVLVANTVIAARQSALAALRAGDQTALARLQASLNVDLIASVSRTFGVVMVRAGRNPQRLDVDESAPGPVIADAIVAAQSPIGDAGDAGDADGVAVDAGASRNTIWWALGTTSVVAVVGAMTLGVWLLWPGEPPPPPPRPTTVSCCGL